MGLGAVQQGNGLGREGGGEKKRIPGVPWRGREVPPPTPESVGGMPANPRLPPKGGGLKEGDKSCSEPPVGLIRGPDPRRLYPSREGDLNPFFFLGGGGGGRSRGPSAGGHGRPKAPQTPGRCPEPPGPAARTHSKAKKRPLVARMRPRVRAKTPLCRASMRRPPQ